MSNLYHIMHKYPALKEEDMYIELESIAKALVNSGLLRIDTISQYNFARLYVPAHNINQTYSLRELTNSDLLVKTKKKLYNTLISRYRKSRNIDDLVDQEIDRLKKEIYKSPPIDDEIEIQISRILVQSCHPVLMLLIFIEQVEVYFSYSYNIADMMDVTTYQTLGENSGMQSTDGKNVAVFVSCGGNPFRDRIKHPNEIINPLDEADEKYYGDGKPALARAMIIAGQEIGHYGDIMRDKFGRQISRHSADFGGRMAKNHVKIARLNDIKNAHTIMKNLQSIKISSLAETERYLRFFKKMNRKGLLVDYYSLKYHITRFIFVQSCKIIGFKPISKFKKEQYAATMIVAMVKDMLFNLEPKADVYSNKDKNIEEAIACIEAVARIPQQVNKWGELTVSFIAPNLYEIYFEEIIPARIADYENITKHKFTMYKFHKIFFIKRYIIKLIRVIKDITGKLYKKLRVI